MNQKPIILQLLSLLRAALWQTPADLAPFAMLPADWNAVRDLAFRQTVGPLACQGALSLPEPYRPPQEWLRAAFAHTVSNLHTHRLLDNCLAESVACLKKAGLRPVLLKGQAYARQYPEATLRQCGDIDLWVGEADYPLACATARHFGWESDPADKHLPNAKHYGCYLRGVSIELHRVAAQLANPSADRRFRRWSREQLSATTRTMQVEGTDILLPPPLFDVVFVFLHLYHHFLNGGIGLRQVCDWVMLLHTHAGVLDRRELHTLLKRFGLLHAWRLFAPIAVEHLGLPEEEFPLYTPLYRSKSEMILAVILREGNFGWYAPGQTERPDGYWRGKLHSYLRYQKRLWMLFSVAPAAVARCYGSYMVRGVKQILFDKLNSRPIR